MTRKALWDKLSPDEQLAWRKERQTNKKLYFTTTLKIIMPIRH